MSNAIIVGVARVGTLPSRRQRHARMHRLAAPPRRAARAAGRPAVRFPAWFALGATGGPLLLVVAASVFVGDPQPRAQLVLVGCGWMVGGLAGASALRAALYAVAFRMRRRGRGALARAATVVGATRVLPVPD